MEYFIETLSYRAWRKVLWSKVGGSDVLEIGVGTGKNIPHYPDRVRVSGIDLSNRMLTQAQRVKLRYSGKNVDLRVMDAQQMEYPEGKFDCVAATFVFCSVPDPVLGLREAYRVTEPGGQLLLLEHMLSTWRPLAWLMQKIDAWVHWLTGVHIARRTVDNVRVSGWVVDRVTPLSPGSIYCLIEAHKA